MSFKDSSIFSSGSHFVQLREPLDIFGRGHYAAHSCEIISNLDRWFGRRCRLKKKVTDEGQRPITIAHTEPLAQVS